MFKKFAMKDDTPPDLEQFEGWFKMSLGVGMLMAILMYDEVVSEWGGPLQAGAVTILLFGGAWVLMVYTSRRRSNLARWLIVIGAVLAIVPYLAHVSLLVEQKPIFLLSLVQIGLLIVAIYYLFTPGTRAWFVGGPTQSEEESEGEKLSLPNVRQKLGLTGSGWFANSRWAFAALGMVGIGYVFIRAWLVTAGPADPVTHTAGFLKHLVSPWMLATYVVVLALIAFGIWYLRSAPKPVIGSPDIERAMKRQTLRLVIAWLLVSASLAAIGFLYIGDLEHTSRRERSSQQEAIAHLKAQQIDKWLLERTLGAEQLANSLRGLPLDRLPADRDVEQTAQLLFAEALAGNTERTGVSLIALDGRVLAHTGDESASDKETTRAAMAIATNAAERRQDIVDVHLGGTPPQPRMVFLTPIMARPGSGPTTAVLAMSIDPYQGLFPQIAAWPTPSPSSEAVVIRREGDDILFLTTPSFLKPAPAPLSFRIPLAGSKMPAAAAVIHGDGVYTGPDYRGVEVVAASRHVTGVPWTVVAKTDREGIARPLQQKELTLVFVVGATIVLAAVMLIVLWRSEYANLLAFHTRQREEQAAMAQQFTQLSRRSRDIILLTGPDGNIIEGNEVALTAYGYSVEELRGLNIRDLQAQEELPNAERRRAATVHRRKNGATFPVEITGLAFDIDGKRYRQTFIRDISDRKKLEEDLHRVLRLLKAFQVANRILLRAQTEIELYQGVCNAFVAAGGYRMATVEIADQNDNNTIRQVAVAGWNGGDPSEAAMAPGHGSSGHGPAELTAKSGAIEVHQDATGNSADALWRAADDRHGDRSIVSFPLRASDQIFGKLTIHAPQSNAFNSAEEVALLKDFTSEISYRVTALRSRAATSRN